MMTISKFSQKNIQKSKVSKNIFKNKVCKNQQNKKVKSIPNVKSIQKVKSIQNVRSILESISIICYFPKKHTQGHPPMTLVVLTNILKV